MFSHLAGLRVGEIAGLRFDDVLETDGSVTDRVHINPAIAKGGVGRTVFVNKRLQREIRRYLEALSALPGPSAPLFRTQKNGAFSANTGQVPVAVSLRYFHEFNVRNRLEGDSGWLTISIPLWVPDQES